MRQPLRSRVPWRRVATALVGVALAVPGGAQDGPPPERARPGALGVRIGRLEPGPHDAITDVSGVRVGHATLWEGSDLRTGVTVVLPHDGDPFDLRVPAAVVVQNGFGKLAGSTQVEELGELESPVALTSTLSVGRVVDALVAWTLEQPGHERVRSVNAVVGETNDGWLSAIERRPVGAELVARALEDASGEPPAGGVVGAGTGTRCLGYKGGIGTASRKAGAWTVGVLVQTNFGGSLVVDGVAVGAELRTRSGERREDPPPEHGSCMIVVATDAPLCARNLRRLALRSFAGMARTGASFSNGSGDYAIAFSNAAELRRPATSDAETVGGAVLRNDAMSPLFVAVAEATEAAIVDALFRADRVVGRDGRTAPGLPVEATLEILRTAKRN